MEYQTIMYWIVSSLMFLVVFMLPGGLLKSIASSEANKALGYRTKRSFLSKETWEYTNKRASNLFLKTGIIYLAIVTIAFILIYFIDFTGELGERHIIASSILPFLFMAYIIFKVERELKSKFDGNGEKNI